MDQINWQVSAFNELSVDELYEILHLRTEVFVVEQDCVYQDMDHYDQKALHFCGWENSQLMAYARIFSPGVKYKEAAIGRVISHASMRKKGIGKKLMTLAIQFCREHYPGVSIKLSAQCYLERFYKELGFEIVSQIYQEDGIDHQEMVLRVES